ncbi:hypothetical protein BpHYR1_044605 [Brachionus plicatilis]|uniref:Uncharacterized protein n=1 Tax=Brachionus plicatilis TaxID=10195 RepID=A0A3M7PSC9_BRAPC|nr:hypothetical protein BpHYR1_044605 [Brachionus plicatilis]
MKLQLKAVHFSLTGLLDKKSLLKDLAKFPIVKINIDLNGSAAGSIFCFHHKEFYLSDSTIKKSPILHSFFC